MAITGSVAAAIGLHSLGISVGGRGSGAIILAAMWIPALARLVATRTADRSWRSPFPIDRWGKPWWIVLALPLAIVSCIYVGAYATAKFVGIPLAPPPWHGISLATNVAVNLPLLAAIGVFGAFGEELGWRGYLQPRLDQLGVRYSLLVVILVETAFHVPMILLAGYTAGTSMALSIALFFALKLGATPVWTWATSRWNTIWMAVCFHAFHNAVSQVLVPKSFGAGDPLLLGETGLLPVAFYLCVAGVVMVAAKRSSSVWT